MQLKYCFNKEKMHFFRTYRFIAIVLIIFGFAIGNPLMFKFCDVVLNTMDLGSSDSNLTSGSNSDSQNGGYSQTPSNIFGGITASVNLDTPNTATADNQNAASVSGKIDPEDPMGSLNGMLGEMGMDDVLALYSDAGIMFATTISTFSGSALLVVMLMLMSAAGGEQKKRAMIVPMASGLQYKNYLIPKFVIYPATIMITTFLASMTAGGLCNLMFANNKVTFGIMLLSSLLIAIYIGFMIAVYLSVGLITSKPGIMTASVYVGQLMLSSILSAIGLRDYHPFALLNYVGGEMVTADFSLAEKAPAIIVSAVLAVVISALMFLLAVGVLGAKKIDNQAEIEPEF